MNFMTRHYPLKSVTSYDIMCCWISNKKSSALIIFNGLRSRDLIKYWNGKARRQKLLFFLDKLFDILINLGLVT